MAQHVPSWVRTLSTAVAVGSAVAAGVALAASEWAGAVVLGAVAAIAGAVARRGGTTG